VRQHFKQMNLICAKAPKCEKQAPIEGMVLMFYALWVVELEANIEQIKVRMVFKMIRSLTFKF